MVTSAGLTTLVVLAGGLGTRMGAYTESTAKALLPVGGEPFLLRQLRAFARQGITDAVVCSGHRADQVLAAVGDGEHLGLRVRHSVEPEPLGAIGALRHARDVLPPSFLLTYCDVVPVVEVRGFTADAVGNGRPAVMAVGRAREPGEANAVLGGDRVTAYAKHPPPPGADCTDLGLLALDRDLLDRHPGRDESAFYGSLARHGELGAVWIDLVGADIGTAHRYESYLRRVRR